jgi:hypothetical protein
MDKKLPLGIFEPKNILYSKFNHPPDSFWYKYVLVKSVEYENYLTKYIVRYCYIDFEMFWTEEELKFHGFEKPKTNTRAGDTYTLSAHEFLNEFKYSVEGNRQYKLNELLDETN